MLNDHIKYSNDASNDDSTVKLNQNDTVINYLTIVLPTEGTAPEPLYDHNPQTIGQYR